jgi:hypothetical protein
MLPRVTRFVRFAARDPGGANVLAATLQAAGPRLPFTYDIWTMPRATPTFTRLGLPTRELPEDVPLSTLADSWPRPARPQVLVTATSHYPGFEPALWSLAGAAGCPSLAVLDSWVNLGERFRHGRPSAVGCIDDEQAAALAGLGFSPPQLVRTGHPWLSLLARAAPVPPRSPTAALVVLFVSEPIASDVAAGVNSPFGYDELDAFAVLHSACAQRARRGRAIDMRIRFHPYEQPDVFRERVAAWPAVPGLRVVSVPASEPAPLSLADADVVAGIGSILLLEAFAAGRPVVSLQPGTRRGNIFVAGQRGVTPTVEDPARAEAILGPLLDEDAARQALVERQRAFLESVSGDASGAVRAWIEGHLSRGADD